MFRKASFIALLFFAFYTVSAQSGDLARMQADLRSHYAAGRYAEALKTSDAIVAATVAQHGKDSLEAARAWANRAAVEDALGETKKAADSLDRASDIFEKFKDLEKPDASLYARVLEQRAGARLGTDMMSAENIFKRALKLRESASGPDSPETVGPLAGLANIRFWRREYREAAETFRRALANLTRRPQPDRSDVTLIYQRARCSMRKAKMETELEELKQLYSTAAEFSTLGDPTVPRKPRLINAGVVNGKALQLIKPGYPVEARRDNAQGIVEVDVLIDEQGTVVSACAAPNAHPALAEASEISAYRSKFSPTTLAGNPVKVSGRITYNFRRN